MCVHFAAYEADLCYTIFHYAHFNRTQILHQNMFAVANNESNIVLSGDDELLLYTAYVDTEQYVDRQLVQSIHGVAAENPYLYASDY